MAGTLLASCADEIVKIWIPLHGEESVYDFKDHTEEVLSIAWSPSGPGTPNENYPLRLATASKDKSVKIWDMETGKCVVTFNYHTEAVNAVAFSPNCEYLSSGGENGTVKIYSIRNQKLIKSLSLPEDTNFLSKRIVGLDWDLESRTVAAACFSCIILIDMRYF